MLKQNLLVALTLFGLMLLLTAGRAEAAVGNASAKILFGTNPVEEFSSAKLYESGDGKVSIGVKLPGYTHFYVLSRPLGFMPGWLATRNDNNDVTVTGPEGLRYIYPADSNHMLTEIKPADTNDVNIVTFDYTGDLLIKQTDGFDPNLYIEYEYDVNGLLDTIVAQADDVNRVFTIEYDGANQVVEIFNASCACGGGSGGFRYEYDASGLVKRLRDANDPNIVIYEYEYNSDWLTDIYLGDANDSNHVRELDYSDGTGGNYIADIRNYTDTNNYRATREYRNSAGVVTKRITYNDPNEDPDDPNDESYVEHIVYIYNQNNTVIRKVAIPPKANASDPPDPNSGIRKEYTYDPNCGDLLTEKWFDANDVNFTVSEYKYEYVPDPCGNILDVRVEYYIDARQAKTEYFYSDNGDVDPNLKVMPEVTEGISDTQQLKYEYEYDPNRNWVTLEKQLDESNTVLVQTKYVYDNYGNVLERWDDYGDSNEVTEHKYNGFNEMVRMKLPSGVVQGWSYNDSGKLESEFVMADPDDFNEPNDLELKLLSQSKYVYDEYGRVTQAAKADDANESGFDFNSPDDWILTEYEYDLRGNRTKVIDDANGLKLETTYKYNKQGEVVQVTLPNGKWTKTYRDGRGLVTKTEVGYASTTVATAEFEYDDNGNLTWQIEPDSARTKYEYDDFDRLIKVTRGL